MSDTTSNASVGGGDAWAALVGSLGIMGNSMLSAWLGNKSSKKAQARAYNYWKSSLKEGPLLTRQGLEAAGYNPMLALGSIGGQAFSANSTPSFAPVGDMVGGAEAGARLGNQLLRGIKLDNEKKRLENANLKSDLDTKEVQRLQMQASEALIQSQTERSDLAYGRDIVGTATDVAGTVGSLYSAKAMRDISRSPKETITTIHHGGKDRPTEIIKSSGKPAIQSTPKAPKPNVGVLGHSAKSVGKVASDLAKMVVLPALLSKPVVELRRKADEVEKTHPRGNRAKGYNFVPRLGL